MTIALPFVAADRARLPAGVPGLIGDSLSDHTGKTGAVMVLAANCAARRI